MLKSITTAVVALGATLALAAPANADVVPAQPKARFYGTCTDNYVAYWVQEDAPGDTSPAVTFDIAKNNVNVVTKTMLPDGYAERHFRFDANGIPKTVEVWADDTLLASHTYYCGFFKRVIGR